MARNKYWAVAKGRDTGIFTSWGAAHDQVNEYRGSCHSAFPTLVPCIAFLLDNGDVSSEDDIGVHVGEDVVPLRQYQQELTDQSNKGENIFDTLANVDTNFPTVVCQNLERIYQYDKAEIADFLSTMFDEQLRHTRLLDARHMLLETLQECFPGDFLSNEMYKRRKLCNIIDDIYILGYCIVHNTKDKRLTKVLKGTTCTSLDVTVHGEDSVVSNGAAIDEPLQPTAPPMDESPMTSTQHEDPELSMGIIKPTHSVTDPSVGRSTVNPRKRAASTGDGPGGSSDGVPIARQTATTTTVDMTAVVQSLSKLTMEVQRLIHKVDSLTEEDNKMTQENVTLRQTVAELTNKYQASPGGHTVLPRVQHRT